MQSAGVEGSSQSDKLSFRGVGLELTRPVVEDAARVSAFMEQEVPGEVYATYFYAMLFRFMPKACLVLKDQASGDIRGAALSMVRQSDKAAILSHFAVSAAARDLRAELLSSFAFNANEQGMTAIIPESEKLNGAGLGLSGANVVMGSAPIAFLDHGGIDLKYTPDKPGAAEIILCKPVAHDGPKMLGVVNDIKASGGSLDIYDKSSYERMATDFRETSIVALQSGKMIGFITGYTLPDRSDLFVWQVGVHPQGQGQGLGKKMLLSLANRAGCENVITTIEPGNTASEALFDSLSRANGSSREPIGEISTEILGGGHLPEIIYSIPTPRLPALRPMG